MSSIWLLPAALVVVMCLALVFVLRRVERAAADLRRAAERLDLARLDLVQALVRLREARAGLRGGGSTDPSRR